jgi:hypothetical protein
MTDLGFQHDEFGIIVPLDAGERALRGGYNNPAALDAIPLNGANNLSHDLSWPTVNLADPAYAIPPDPPAIAGLLYEGKRHVASGPQESAKTLIAYHLLLQALRSGAGVGIVDLEMGPVATRRMLTDLGATASELAALVYTEPTGPPTEADISRLSELAVRYVLIDAAAGAFDLTGLDDNSRKDAESWARQWVQPLFQRGIATIVLDHVTKNVEGRGKYAIGSERKTGGADVHLGFDALKTLTRGGTGVVKVTAHKDRGAYLQRPTVAIIELASDPDTHQITIDIRPPEPSLEPETGEFRHTIYMERVSKVLEANDGQPMSKNKIETADGGNRDHIRTAIAELLQDGYVIAQDGPNNSILIHLKRRFRKQEFDLAHGSPTVRPGEVPTTSPTVRPDPLPSVGVTGRAGANVGEPSGTDHLAQPENDPLDVYDPSIQHLMDDLEY